MVAGIGARAFRGRTVAATADQETARRHELSRYRYRAGSGWGRRRPSRAEAEVQAEEQGRGGGDSNDPGLTSLVLSLEARLRAVEAATYSVVLVQRETSLPFKNMREAGKKYAQLMEAKGRREHDLGSPHLHVFLTLLSTLTMYMPPQGVDQAVLDRVDQNVAGKGHRAPDADRAGRVGHDVSSRGLLRQASAGETGSHLNCHERNDGSVVTSFRSEASNPASSSWTVPTSRRNHDEADERTERARLALVRARREAQGGDDLTRRECTSTRQAARTTSQNIESSILLLMEGRTSAVPSRRGTSRRL